MMPPPLHSTQQVKEQGVREVFVLLPQPQLGSRPLPSSQASLPPLNLSLLCPGRLHVGLQVERFMKDVEGFPPYRKLFVCVCTLMGGLKGYQGKRKRDRQKILSPNGHLQM